MTVKTEPTKTLKESELDLNAMTYRSNDVRATIIIPLAQNVIGGGALTILLALVAFAFDRLNDVSSAFAIAAGLVMACLATIIRFFADDFGLLGVAYRRGWDDCEEEHAVTVQQWKDEFARMETNLAEAVRPIIVNKSTRDTFVAPESADPAHEDAKRILDMMPESDSRVPGRHRTQLTQVRQEAALSVMARASVLMRKGNNYELNCTPSQAQVALNRLVD